MLDQPRRFQRRMDRVLESAQVSEAELDIILYHPRLAEGGLIDIPDDMRAGIDSLDELWFNFLDNVQIEWAVVLALPVAAFYL